MGIHTELLSDPSIGILQYEHELLTGQNEPVMEPVDFHLYPGNGGKPPGQSPSTVGVSNTILFCRV